MKPKTVAEHAFEGSVATFASGRRRLQAVIEGCNEPGTYLRARVLHDGFRPAIAPISIPAAKVLEIRHGKNSTAPDWAKRIGGVR